MFPFTPLRSYIARSVPVIEATVLNLWQSFFGDLAVRVIRQRPAVYLHSYDGVSLLVEYIRGSFVIDATSSQWVAVEVPEPGVTLTVANLVPTAMTFAASTWYYVYLRSANRIPSFVISTTAPSTDRLFGADQTYRYACCFRTNSSSQIAPFHQRDGRFFYTGGAGYDAVFNADITSNSWASLGSVYFPPKVRRGTVLVHIDNQNTMDTEIAHLLPGGISGLIVRPGDYGKPIYCPICPGIGLIAQVDQRVEVELADGPNQLSGKLSHSVGLSTASLVVEGFEDW